MTTPDRTTARPTPPTADRPPTTSTTGAATITTVAATITTVATASAHDSVTTVATTDQRRVAAGSDRDDHTPVGDLAATPTALEAMAAQGGHGPTAVTTGAMATTATRRITVLPCALLVAGLALWAAAAPVATPGPPPAAMLTAAPVVNAARHAHTAKVTLASSQATSSGSGRSAAAELLPEQGGPAGGSAGNANQLYTVLQNIIRFAQGLLVLLASVSFTVAGIRYLAAMGDMSEIDAAKRTAKAAVLGFAIAALASALAALLSSIFGVA